MIVDGKGRSFFLFGNYPRTAREMGSGEAFDNFGRSRVYVSECDREAICTWKCVTFLQSLVKFKIDERSLSLLLLFGCHLRI